ncbi:L,D-transpeptidase family protein [Arachnia propionica]|uniref:L,D-transpeptidase family protein n=1 Tax=Arachnia propionica TaxID=1750 RepID=UPI001F3E8E68|nr:L,D-transpeptidase family protein [Arachnia propionica]
MDQATMDSLTSMTRKPTEDEKNNVLKPGPALMAKGASGDKVKDLQARLKQIGWYGPDVNGEYDDTTVESVKGFQGKRQLPVTGEVDQRTLDRITSMTRKPTQDELNNVKPTQKPANSGMTLDDRCLQGRVLCISKSQRKLSWVIDGQVQMTLSVRFGSDETPTRNGVFSVGWKSRDHVSTLYHTPMPYAMFFSGGQAVHYSADFARTATTVPPTVASTCVTRELSHPCSIRCGSGQGSGLRGLTSRGEPAPGLMVGGEPATRVSLQFLPTSER